MGWLDPPECNVARHCLETGNVAEAARLLIASKYPDHRAVRGLRLEAGQRLVCLAGQQYEAGNLEAADAAIRLAAECMALEGEALALQQRIAQGLMQKQQHQQWVAAKLANAQQLATAGRFHSALDVLAPVGGAPEAARLQADIQQLFAQLERHLSQCREALQSGQLEAAYLHWQAAHKLAPQSPEVAELASAVAQARQPEANGHGQAVAVCDRRQSLVLGGLALVVSAGEVCIGTPRGEGVHVPVYAPLHSRHAVLLRDRQGWQLAACGDRHGRPCRAAVDGRRVESTVRLADGSLLELGERDCKWRFRLPIAGSATAVLEPIAGSCGVVALASGRIDCVALMEDCLVLRAHHPAHIVLPHLPCKQLRLYWKDGRLLWEVEGGLGRLEVPGRTLAQDDNQVYVPSRLHIEPHLDEAELLGRAAAGCEPGQGLVLEFIAPSRSEQT